MSKWLRSNKISLNTSKTEIIIFRPKRKTIQKHLNFRISGQQIKTSTHVKYLSIHLDQHLDWNLNMTTLPSKLNRAIELLSKIRHYVPKFLLRTLLFYALQLTPYLCLSSLGIRSLTSVKTLYTTK